jgi:hypothetical protein
MNEFGEDLSIYVTPANHTEGEPYPEDFNKIVEDALTAAGIDWEWT